MSPTTDVVIASYREDLRWLKWLPSSWRPVVYCTDEERRDLPDGTTLLPNTAREAGQYLYHLATWYDDLADVTLFLQGGPWHHGASVLVDTILNESLPHPICYLGAHAPNKATAHKPHFDQAKAILRKAYGAIGREGDTGAAIPFSVGAQFYVRREVVHALPQEFYQRLLEATAEEDTQPGFAHMMEANWGCAFEWQSFFK